MISTPETGVDSIAVTWALLDPIMTVLRPISAFFTASVTGLTVNLLDPEKIDKGNLHSPGKGALLPMAAVSSVSAQPHGCGHTDHGHSADTSTPGNRNWQKLKRGMAFSFGTLLGEIGPWLLIGIGLAAIISVFLSPDFIHAYMGSGILSMLIMIVLATPLYVCATASTPIAAALALKGLSPGAALVFLLAGPATNMATITVVAKLLGRKTAIIYVSSIMICSLLMGMAVNMIYFSLGLNIADWVHQEALHTHGFIYSLSAVILLILILKPLIMRFFVKAHPQSINTH